VLNQTALRKAGWTPALIAAVLGAPDRVEEHRRGYHRWSEHLYEEARVKSGERDARFVAVAERRRERSAAAARRRAEIPRQFASWREALPEAAAMLFSLNRYAKHRTCAAPNRVEIYQLKNEFIRLLYERGYCTTAWVHRLTWGEQLCRECGGEGGADGDCSHCDGSGVWRSARTVEFWCFRFVVAGRPYCWHQPRADVEFAPAEGLPPQEWDGPGGEKPVALPRRRQAWAKELLRWTIDAAGSEAAVAEAASSCAGGGRSCAQMPLFAA
jgi:hypothetical protein